jgi:hypothetical protein
MQDILSRPNERIAAFERLCSIEPRLHRLYRKAERLRSNDLGEVIKVWHYGRFPGDGLKCRIDRLVGYARRQDLPAISSSSDYDAAYFEILSVLDGTGRA